jgi:hypothetical protein
MIDGLQPPRDWPLEVHCGDTDPDLRIDPIHLEVGFTTRLPEFWVFTLEFRKIHLREFP